MRLLAPRQAAVTRLQLILVLLALAMLIWSCAVKARTPAAVASIGLGLFWLFRTDWAAWPIRLWRGAPAAALRYFKRLDYSLLAALPVVYAISILYSGDVSFTLKHLRLTLTFMSVSSILYLYRRYLAPYRNWGWLCIVVIASVSAFACIAYVIFNHDALVVALGSGNAVPTPRSHVRSATMFAFAAIIGVHLATQKGAHAGFKTVGFIGAVITTVAVHVIAVRTGLVMLYGGLILYALRLVLSRFNSKRVLIAGSIALLIGLFGVTQLPTVQRKIQYTVYDLKQLDSPDATRYSDASRVLSVQAASEILKESPFLGAHQLGVREEMKAAYAKTGYAKAHLLPTNQYLFSWVLAGLPGLLAVVLFFIAPMLERGWLRRPLLAEFLILTAMLCLVETPFANDVGVALSVLVICISKLGWSGAKAAKV